MAFKNLKDTAEELIAQRGYSMIDMKEVGERVAREKRDWIRQFDSYIENILYNEMKVQPEEIVDLAAKLADARHEKLKEIFGETYAE